MDTKYGKGKIYKLTNTVNDEVYVGSTIQSLNQRLSGHKYLAKIKPDRHIYKCLLEIGWDNVKIELVEEYPCNSNDELLTRERYWIETLNSSLNKLIPNRTKKEYREANRDILNAKKKEYYEDNKEQIKEKIKEYYEANKEKIKEWSKKYYKDNKEQIKAKAREIYARKKLEAN